MKRLIPQLLLVVASLTAVGLAAPQTSQGAGITVTATPLSGAEAAAAGLRFRLELDTHSGDLMTYDLAALATLRTSEGRTVSEGFSWQGESESSHHRAGVLRLDAAAGGAALITGATTYLELELRDVGVPSRVFRWEGEALAPLRVASEETAYVFVPAIADGAVVAIDPTTLEVAWRLAVSQGSETRGAESAMGIAVSPDGRTVYTGDAATDALVVVDAETREVAARVQLNHKVHAIDLSPDGRYLWVDGGLEGYPWLSATSVIDTRTLEVVRTLSPGLGTAAHLSFTPDGREVWAASVTTNLVWAWDAATGEVLAAVPLTRAPLAARSPEAQQGLIGFNEVAISPDGDRAYAVGPEASVVFAIDVASRQLVGTAQVGERAHGIAVTKDGAEVWTANRSGSVTVIDAASLQVTQTLELGAYANHVSFSPDGALAYVSRQDDVAVIDVRSREVVKEIAVGKEPHEFSLKDQAAQLTGGR